MKVCVYAISKNEAAFAERFMRSVAGADHVFVLDTGSTDGTVGRLRALGADVAVRPITPWRFDVARNEAMRLCPPDCDVLLSLDIDEVIVEPDWADRVRTAWTPNATRGVYHYVWSVLPDGRDGCHFLYNKMHTFDHRWKFPCHECLHRAAPGEDVWVNIPMTVRHLPDPDKSRGSYLALLRTGCEENPLSDYCANYYGRELLFYGRWAEAAEQLKRSLAISAGGWADGRCAAMSMVARCHDATEEYDEAEKWHYRACAEASHLREPFLEAAHFFNCRGQHHMAYAFAKRALRVTERTESYVVTARSWNEWPFDEVAVAAYHLGRLVESYSFARRASELAPWDERLKRNLEKYRGAVR